MTKVKQAQLAEMIYKMMFESGYTNRQILSLPTIIGGSEMLSCNTVSEWFIAEISIGSQANVGREGGK